MKTIVDHEDHGNYDDYYRKHIVHHEDHGNYGDFNDDVLMMTMTGELMNKSNNQLHSNCPDHSFCKTWK